MNKRHHKEKIGFLGMRVVKTTLSVYLCFLIAYLRNQSPLHSTFSAIISTKQDHEGGIVAGKDRLLGTCIGGAFGLIGILVISLLGLRQHDLMSYLIYSIFMIPIIYSNMLLKSSESVTLSTIVFISIVLSTDEMIPIYIVLNRIVETLIGVVVAIVVNMVL